jgi:Zn-dependent protease
MTSHNVSAPAPPTSDEALLAAVTARGEATSTRASSTTLLITAGLFLAFGGLRWGWTSVAFLAIAIAIHELGHVLAMRLCGYKNVRMLFIPLFGGLAQGQPQELDATKNALVALAGPALGIASAALAGLTALAFGSPEWLVTFAWISLGLNAFNLAPLVPLDGGQFTNDALFSRHPLLELLFRLAAVAVLGWFAFNARDWLLGALMLLMLISASPAYRRACLVRDARLDPLWQTRPLDLEAVATLREKVETLFKNAPKTAYEPKLPEHVHGLWMEIRKRFPGPGRTVALMAAYLFLCAVAVPAVAFFFLFYLPRPAF